jgi:hypothetical protein
MGVGDEHSQRGRLSSGCQMWRRFVGGLTAVNSRTPCALPPPRQLLHPSHTIRTTKYHLLLMLPSASARGAPAVFGAANQLTGNGRPKVWSSWIFGQNLADLDQISGWVQHPAGGIMDPWHQISGPGPPDICRRPDIWLHQQDICHDSHQISGVGLARYLEGSMIPPAGSWPLGTRYLV